MAAIAKDPEIEIVVISLKSAAERRARVAASLSRSPLRWSFFDAIDRQIDELPSYDDVRTRCTLGRSLTPQEIGCYLSHYTVLRDFSLCSKNDWMLVVEDDVTIDPNFPYSALSSLLQDSEINCLRLFSRWLKPSAVVGFFYHYQIVRFNSTPYGTQAYLISRAGAAAIVQTIGRICRPIDWEFDRSWAHGVQVYCLHPSPVLENFGTSSLARRAIRPLSSSERLAFHLNRSFEKTKKEWTNLQMRLLRDPQLRRRLPTYGENTEVTTAPNAPQDQRSPSIQVGNTSCT